MASVPILFTPRDREVLVVLDRTPLTAHQLLLLSETFSLPFTSERKVRARLQLLADRGWVCRWPLAIAGRGMPNYYTLSRLGYRLLHGPDEQPASKRSFTQVGIARQHHTHSLAAFLVHTLVAAHRLGLPVSRFFGENALRLTIAEDCLYPDTTLALRVPKPEELLYYVEIDNSSERVQSGTLSDSWDRKIRLYEALQDATGRRFRVLVIATRSHERVEHILQRASVHARTSLGRPRRLFYGTTLERYLREPQPLTSPCFHDHDGHASPLIPASVLTPPLPPAAAR